jgi:hypothetical protein
MRTLISAGTLVLLCGCSTVSAVRDAWKWDPTREERTRVALSAEHSASLTNRVAELQLQRVEVRSRISAEPDIWARQSLYGDLHRVGQQLSLLERQLWAGAPAR